ncbi:hypothetical protein L6452_34643 [Arctium lappa]|uniref:Uncharacterized protein n=1 Tax=Arctium lappa TaxID=4217 RepID=A0ACB8YIW4_ARCLA|nr:hypothetical protein L6452_34643 [Arctium lappa]
MSVTSQVNDLCFIKLFLYSMMQVTIQDDGDIAMVGINKIKSPEKDKAPPRPSKPSNSGGGNHKHKDTGQDGVIALSGYVGM